MAPIRGTAALAECTREILSIYLLSVQQVAEGKLQSETLMG